MESRFKFSIEDLNKVEKAHSATPSEEDTLRYQYRILEVFKDKIQKEAENEVRYAHTSSEEGYIQLVKTFLTDLAACL